MAKDKYIIGGEDEAGNLSYYDGVAYKPIGCLTNTSYSAAMQYLEKVNYCTGGKTVRIPKGLERTLSVEGELIDTTSVGGNPAKVTGTEMRELQEVQGESGESNIFRLGRADAGYLYFEATISQYDDSFPSGEQATFSMGLDIKDKPSKIDPNI